MSARARQRNPRGEGAKLREPLLRAAVEVIDEVGDVSKVSVRAITKRAGVSPTALYLHFADRDEIVDAAIDAGFAAFNDAVLSAAAEHSDPRERLIAMGDAYLAFVDRQPALYSVIFSARRPAGRITEQRPGAVDRAAGFEVLMSVVTELTGPADAPDIAVALWSGLHGFATLRVSATPKEWPEPDAFVRRLFAAYIP